MAKRFSVVATLGMKHLVVSLALAAAALPVAAQSGDAIVKRQEARFAALRSGQGREQFYSRDYISINPPGQIVVGYQPGPQGNPGLYVKDIKVIAATQNGAVITHLQGPRPAEAQFPSTTDPDRFLEVWANEQGTWKIVARQGVWVRPADSASAAARIKAPNVTPYQGKTAAEREIFDAHQKIEDAFGRRDTVTYERLTVPEFIRIGERGEVVSRGEWVKGSVANASARQMPLAEDVRIRVYGDVAVMTHRHIGRDPQGMTPPVPLRMMRAWVHRPDGWKLAATITTNVMPAR